MNKGGWGGGGGGGGGGWGVGGLAMKKFAGVGRGAGSEGT